MNLISQVCTEEQAERLKQLGVCQLSLFYHTNSDWGVMPRSSIDFSGNPSSAFTVAELGVMLPPGCVPEKSSTNAYWHDYIKGFFMTFKTEAEARAATLIDLIERNVIKIADVNNRLNNK